MKSSVSAPSLGRNQEFSISRSVFLRPPHYADLLADRAAGHHRPMPFTRKAVEAAMEERI